VQTINEIFGELAALVTGFAVAGATLDGPAHLNHSWIYWVLGCLVFAGVGMVVENAANGGYVSHALSRRYMASSMRRSENSKTPSRKLGAF